MKVKILTRSDDEAKDDFEKRIESFLLDKEIKFINYAISECAQEWEENSYYNNRSEVFIVWEEKE